MAAHARSGAAPAAAASDADPRYSLAADPEPGATAAALLRTVSLGRQARFTAS